MRVRSVADSKVLPMNAEAKPDYGSLSIGGGTAFASASNPSAEVIDGTGVSAGNSSGVTLSATNGTITVDRDGTYQIELNLADFSCGAASGNVQFDVQYAPDGTTFAAFGTTAATGGGGRMQAIRLALTSKESIAITKPQQMVRGSAIRAIVTSAAGNAITVTEGALTCTQLVDSSTPTPV